MSRSIATAVPAFDAAEFARLPEPVRMEVRLWMRLLEPVFSAEKGKRVEAITRAAKVAGVSFQLARKKFYDLRETGDWKTLINKAKAREASQKLPAEIVEAYRAYCERNNRNNRTGHRAMIREWKAGLLDHLPWPKIDPATDQPRGCSYENLSRYGSSKFELLAARRGRSAAADHRPLVFRTRANLRVGQFFLFDDIWHDHKVHVNGQAQARRPLEFHALDLFSGCKFAWGIKAQMESLETGRMEHLKEREMRFLVAGILGGMTSIGLAGGYDPDGCTLVVEHGTASISDEMEGMLSDLSGGMITVKRSGIQGAAAFAGQYAGRSKGNFRMKAALESLGSLIHSELAYLPGQTGSNARLNGPEELAGREKVHDALCRAMLALPKEQSDLLRLPFLDLGGFRQVAAAIYHRINSRTEHELEGWLEAGLVAHEFRLDHDQPWISTDRLLAMPIDRQASIAALIDSGTYLSRVRRRSPLDVFTSGIKRLARFAPHQVAMILGKDCGCERQVRRGLFEFEDAETGPGIYRFSAMIGNEPLRDGERFFTVMNPMDDQRLHVFDAAGRWLGQCQRWNSIGHADVDALARQCGAAAKIEAAMLYPVARRGAELTKRRIEDARHNADLLSGRPVTPKAKARSEELAGIVKGMSTEEIAAAIGSPSASECQSGSDPDGHNQSQGDHDFSHEEISDLFRPNQEAPESPDLDL